MTCALVQSNAEAPKAATDALCRTLQRLVSEVSGRAEAYVMVGYERVQSLSFGGSDLPAAKVCVSQTAELRRDRQAELVQRLTAEVSGALGVEAGRVCVVLSLVQPSSWGCNGATFE